jgi:hypothetical protein
MGMSSNDHNLNVLPSKWGIREDQLVTLKLHESYKQLHEGTAASWRRIRHEQRQLGQQQGPGYYARLCDAAITVLRELLRNIDRACREVQSKKGGSIDAEFIRSVLLRKVFEAIEARKASVRGELELMARRTKFKNLTPALHHLARATNRLKADFSNQYEVEIRELELVRSRPQNLVAPVISELSEFLTPSELDEQNPAAVKSGDRRKSVVMPILQEKGWSIHDLAINSTVDFHTANDYINGRTKPYSSTRKKLAESLGIKVQDLPK